MKKLVVFDLDGTLAESKSSIDAEMSMLLSTLMGVVKVAIISGGDWPQFAAQVLSSLPDNPRLVALSLLPTCGTKFLRHDGQWKKIYSEDLATRDKEVVVRSLEKAVAEAGFAVDRVWGQTIEDRGSQITFSALGQQAPLKEKASWDPDFTKRTKIKSILEALLPGFSVRMGGTTSIDVTKAGIDKAYGIRKLRDILGIATCEMMYVGDAVFPGGNDYPVVGTGVVAVQVRDPHETKRVIETVVACLGCATDNVRKTCSTGVVGWPRAAPA